MAEPHIQAAVSELMSQFRISSAALLQITVGNIIERDKGLYGFMYGKPSHRLAAALTADREILILFSTFPDQQQRTVATAKIMIQESAGRLESGIVIVVHCDPRGSSKLKNWGREQGISVLPVYVGAEPLPQGDNFERLLCVELYSYDPFDVTGPVADDAQFFGRRTEAQDLARKLQTGQIRSCFGIRKIGKTSILNRVLADAGKYHDCTCIMLDCSLDEIWSGSADALLNEIAASVERAIASGDSYATVSSAASRSGKSGAERLLAAIVSCTKPLILFIDEIDYITPGSPTGQHWREQFNIFWRSLRAAYQESTRRSHQFSMLISGVSSKWFSVESVGGIENAALALVPEEYMSPLPRGAAVAMIKKMARIAGLQFDDRSCEVVAGACSDMPFWIRKACSHIHRALDVTNRPVVPEEERVRELVVDFIQNDGATIAQVAIAHLFRVFPELADTCRACASGGYKDQPPQLVKALERYGVIDSRNTFKLSGLMIQAGFELYESLPRGGAVEPVGKPAIDNVYGQWAEDLAVISKRRNVLERQLRELALNFLRFDSLSTKGNSASERVLATLSKERRNKLRGMTGEALIGKLLWTELMTLLKREWPLFEKLLGDATLLQQHGDIINDRPDTHAKPLAAADIALQDRSLKWFEERLAAV